MYMASYYFTSVRIDDLMIARNIASIATCYCFIYRKDLWLSGSEFLHCAGPHHIWMYNLGAIK